MRFEIDGPVAVATLARAPVNAIDETFLEALGQAARRAAREPAVGVLHIRSTARAFSAGADLAYMSRLFEDTAGREAFLAFVARMQQIFDEIERLPLVTVAEIGGAAMGGGLELALACDLRVAAEEARMGLPEASLGLVPGAGGTQRLARLTGEAAARRLILGAEVVDGAQARALGMVQWAVPGGELPAFTEGLVARIADLPKSALAACKSCIDAGLRGEDGLARERESTLALLGEEQTRARVRALLAGRGR